MLNPDQVSWVIALGTLLAMSGAILAVIGGGVLRMRNRRPGRSWSRLVSLLSGASVGGLFLQGWSQPLEGALFVAVAGIVSLWLLRRDRRVLTGIFLAAAALPWTLLWGLYVVLLLSRQADFAPLVTVTFFAIGLILVLAGVVLALLGDPAPTTAAATVARPRRVGLVAEAIQAPELVGALPVSELASLFAVFGGVLAVGLLPVPGLAEPVAQVLVGTLLGSEARLHVRPGRVKRAYEAFSWLGEWELERVRSVTRGGVPTSKRAAEPWLRGLPDRPDTRWIRVEVLALLDRLDEAREVAESMPADTSWERFERMAALDLLDWLRGDPGDPEGLRAAAADVRPEGPEMHLRAEVAVAVREVAREVVGHGPEDALGPLVAVRDRLGDRANGQLRRALWGRTLPISLITAVITTYLMSPFG